MPDMDGLSAAAELRKHRRLDTLPIIAMTAHAMVGDKEKSLSVGMNAHITKPIDSDELFTVMAQWLTLNPNPGAALSALSHDTQEPPSSQEHSVSELPSNLPGIDVASGLARVAGNKNLYLKLLRHVANDAPNTREKLITAIGEGNAQVIREIAHSLKGATSNLSIMDVAAAAEHLEHAAKEEDFSVIPGHLEALETALEAYVAVVESLSGL